MTIIVPHKEKTGNYFKNPVNHPVPAVEVGGLACAEIGGLRVVHKAAKNEK